MDEYGQAGPPPGTSRDGVEHAAEAPEPTKGAEPGAGRAEQEPRGADEYPGPSQGQRPLGVGVTPTGHGPVDERLRRLEDADHLAVAGHLEVYEDVHRGLRETLAALDRNEQ